MKISKTLRLFAALALLCALSLHGAKAADPPNVILILADDLGYAELGCYGGPLNTPAMDRLAREGFVAPTATPPSPFAPLREPRC